MTTTKTIFRTFLGDNSVVALFPEVPADSHLGHCLSYQAIGQHSAASVDLSHVSRPATPDEYAPLLRELERIGYAVQVCRRSTPEMNRKRIFAMNRQPQPTP